MKRRLAALAASVGVSLAVVIGGPVTTTDTSEPYLKAVDISATETVVSLENVGTPPPASAQAGECTIAWASVLCGRIKNHGPQTVRLIQGWPNVYGIHLPVGRTSSSWYRDTDGIYLYSNQKAFLCAPGGYCSWFYGPRAVKITDNFGTWRVDVHRK